MAVKLIFLDADSAVETEIYFPVNTTQVLTASGSKEAQSIIAGVDAYLFPEFGNFSRIVDQVEVT